MRPMNFLLWLLLLVMYVLASLPTNYDIKQTWSDHLKELSASDQNATLYLIVVLTSVWQSVLMPLAKINLHRCLTSFGLYPISDPTVVVQSVDQVYDKYQLNISKYQPNKYKLRDCTKICSRQFGRTKVGIPPELKSTFADPAFGCTTKTKTGTIQCEYIALVDRFIKSCSLYLANESILDENFKLKQMVEFEVTVWQRFKAVRQHVVKQKGNIDEAFNFDFNIICRFRRCIERTGVVAVAGGALIGGTSAAWYWLIKPFIDKYWNTTTPRMAASLHLQLTTPNSDFTNWNISSLIGVAVITLIIIFAIYSITNAMPLNHSEPSRSGQYWDLYREKTFSLRKSNNKRPKRRTAPFNEPAVTTTMSPATTTPTGAAPQMNVKTPEPDMKTQPKSKAGPKTWPKSSLKMSPPSSPK